jgi:hypothetical protein
MSEPMTSADFLKRHMPHRLSVLKGFLECPQDAGSRNLYNAAKDGAIVTCRPLWKLIGVCVRSEKETSPDSPTVDLLLDPDQSPKVIAGISIPKFSQADKDALQLREELVKVLVAANKCVAHFDTYVDHGVGHPELERVVHLTIDEIKKRIPGIQDCG